MNILLFGATGMVGQGVLHECLLDLDVNVVQGVGRTATGLQHAKLREIVQKEVADLIYSRSNAITCSNSAPPASVPATVAVSVLPAGETS
jgi:saccharopine dehydrogenase-like NADP-dependent oxidoreductase